MPEALGPDPGDGEDRWTSQGMQGVKLKGLSTMGCGVQRENARLTPGFSCVGFPVVLFTFVSVS